MLSIIEKILALCFIVIANSITVYFCILDIYRISKKKKGVKMSQKDLDQYMWIVNILNEVTVTRRQFMNLVENNPPKEVDKMLKGKIVDIERDRLIESLFK
jgi:hypothetical protein